MSEKNWNKGPALGRSGENVGDVVGYAGGGGGGGRGGGHGGGGEGGLYPILLSKPRP